MCNRELTNADKDAKMHFDRHNVAVSEHPASLSTRACCNTDCVVLSSRNPQNAIITAQATEMPVFQHIAGEGLQVASPVQGLGKDEDCVGAALTIKLEMHLVLLRPGLWRAPPNARSLSRCHWPGRDCLSQASVLGTV